MCKYMTDMTRYKLAQSFGLSICLMMFVFFLCWMMMNMFACWSVRYIDHFFIWLPLHLDRFVFFSPSILVHFLSRADPSMAPWLWNVSKVNLSCHRPKLFMQTKSKKEIQLPSKLCPLFLQCVLAMRSMFPFHTFSAPSFFSFVGESVCIYLTLL